MFCKKARCFGLFCYHYLLSNKKLLIVEYTKLQKLAVNYLNARKEFLQKTKDLEHLQGNDNIMGRIGELIALEFFKREEGIILSKAKKKNEKEYDLCSPDRKRRVSVKLMSCENQHGQTTKITGDWTDLVFVYLTDYKVTEIGYINRVDFNRAVKDGFISSTPVTSRRMLEPAHLFGEYGQVKKGREIKGYL